MSMKKTARAPGEKATRALLEKHGCPVPFHEVRTRFLGNIATPDPTASPLRVIEGLWGGELPIFDSMEEAEALIGTLVQGLWNDLAQHQKRSHPFRLIRVPMEPTAANLERYGVVRHEELVGFIEGIFNGADEIDLPERAHEAVGNLTEMRGMAAGIRGLASRDPGADDPTELESTFKSLRELTRVMETEIHEAVLSCARARRRGLEGLATEKSTVH